MSWLTLRYVQCGPFLVQVADERVVWSWCGVLDRIELSVMWRRCLITGCMLAGPSVTSWHHIPVGLDKGHIAVMLLDHLHGRHLRIECNA